MPATVRRRPFSRCQSAHTRNNCTWHWIILSNWTQFRISKGFYRYNFFDPLASLWGSYIFQSFRKRLLEALLRVTEGFPGHRAFCFKCRTVGANWSELSLLLPFWAEDSRDERDSCGPSTHAITWAISYV